MWMHLTLALAAPAQETPPAATGQPIVVALAAKAPDTTADGAGRGPRWSPKGEKVALQRADTVLLGELQLGPEGAPPIQVVLTSSEGAAHVDRLLLDANRDGVFDASERHTTTPREQRGKWWSSFEATVDVVHPGADGAAARRVPYPMALWFVADPLEPDAPPALRWSRRGWFEGAFELDGRPAYVLVSELAQDGVLTRDDVWFLARERQELYGTRTRGLDRHAWLDGRAYRVTTLAADGSQVVLEPFDPGVTEAEEAAREDALRADREAPRAAAPLAFGHDLAAALAQAKQERKRVFLDFETTWCGPCKQMDQLVYTAAAVVEAAAGVVPVKLDGDVERELVKRYEVAAYPTLLVLDADGKVLRRAVGYTSVAETAKLLRD